MVAGGVPAVGRSVRFSCVETVGHVRKRHAHHWQRKHLPGLVRRPLSHTSTSGGNENTILGYGSILKKQSVGGVRHLSTTEASSRLPSLKSRIISRLSQDPRGRIRFTPSSLHLPWREAPKFSYDMFQTPTLDEIHCVPFWQVTHMVRYSQSTVNRVTGVSLNQASRTADFGFSISAVADDHWCSGVVLRDQVRNTFELLEVRREREYRQGYKSPKSDDGEMSVADFERWLSPFADDLPISHIPPFAKGYPRISKAELARLIATCTEGENAYLENDFTERWMAHFLEDPIISAIPTYRIVGKSTLNGRIGFFDGMFARPAYGQMSAHQFTLPSLPPRVYDNPDRPRGLGFAKWDHAMTADGRSKDDPMDETSMPFIFAEPPKNDLLFAKMAVAAQNQAPLNWEDPMILPADLSLGKANIKSLVEYATRRILQYKTGPPPQAFRPTPSTSTPSNISTTSSGPSLLRRIIPSRPIAAAKGTATGPKKADVSSAPTKPLLPPSRRSQPQLRPRMGPPPSTRPASTPNLVKQQLPPLTIRDPEGWYKALEIFPSPKMIDLAEASMIDRSLREKWHSLITMYHTDRAAAADEGETMQAKAVRINEAYRELKTFKQREYYQQHGRGMAASELLQL